MLRVPSALRLGAVSSGVCFVAGCAILAAAAFALADSSPRRQARSTHLGVGVNDLVALISSGSGTSMTFTRMKGDGTLESSAFVVPTGYRMIVTDIEALGQMQSSTESSVLRLFIENRTTSTSRTLAATRYCRIESDGYVNSGNAMGFGDAPLTGFTLLPSGKLVADLTSQSTNPTTATYPQSTTSSLTVIVRGYLVSDE
jgi:hypothetical protein